MNKTVFVYGNTGFSSLISPETCLLTHLMLHPTWNKVEENFIFQLQVKVYSHWYYFLQLTNLLYNCCFPQLRFGLAVLCESIVSVSVKSWPPGCHVCTASSNVKDFYLSVKVLKKLDIVTVFQHFILSKNFLCHERCQDKIYDEGVRNLLQFSEKEIPVPPDSSNAIRGRERGEHDQGMMSRERINVTLI